MNPYQAKLEQAVREHNDLNQQEQSLQQQLQQVHEQRMQALGRVKVLDELWAEEESKLKGNLGAQNGQASDREEAEAEA